MSFMSDRPWDGRESLQSPLDVYNDDELTARYRFDRQHILEMVDVLSDHIGPWTERSHTIPATLQVLIALQYYASGSMQLVVADMVGVSQPTVSRVVIHVTQAINGVFRGTISLVMDADDMLKKNSDFSKLVVSQMSWVSYMALMCQSIPQQGVVEMNMNMYTAKAAIHSTFKLFSMRRQNWSMLLLAGQAQSTIPRYCKIHMCGKPSSMAVFLVVVAQIRNNKTNKICPPKAPTIIIAKCCWWTHTHIIRCKFDTLVVLQSPKLKESNTQCCVHVTKNCHVERASWSHKKR